MEEQALSVALEALRKSQCTVILDLKSREAKTNLFFLLAFLSPLSLRTLRIKSWGELYIFVIHEIASPFGVPFIGEVSTTHPQLFFFYFQQTPIISTFWTSCRNSWELGFYQIFWNSSPTWVLAALLGLSNEELLWQRWSSFVHNLKTLRFWH